MTLKSRTAALLLVLCTGIDQSGVLAQSQAPSTQTEGWQGPRPALQPPSPRPQLQRQGPAGAQVLEIPGQQQQPVPQSPARQQAIIPLRRQPEDRRPTQLVTVTVTDQRGRYVRGLQPEDFVLYENDRPQPITYFTTGQQEPVSIGFLVDVSGSMKNKIGAARRALDRFVDTIHRHDEIFLTAFNERPHMLQDFTDSRALLQGATGRLDPHGETALYDAVLAGLQRIEYARRQKRVLVVITDGVDNASRASLERTLAAVRRAGVIVYTIGVGDPRLGLPMRGSGMYMPPMRRGRVGGYRRPRSNEIVDFRVLQTLSDQTGGKSFLLNTADVIGNTSVLDDATRAISQELRQQYSLGYRSPLKGDLYRDVRVKTRNGEFVVRTHKGTG